MPSQPEQLGQRQHKVHFGQSTQSMTKELY